jgi:hypothetical protein
MRPKWIVAAVLLAGLALGSAWLLDRNRGTTGSPAPRAGSAAPAPTETNVEVVAASAPVAAPSVATKVMTAEEREAAIDAEADRLQEWSMSGDPAALTNILADLSHPEREVREAAIEAAEQFGSTNAIPALKAAAASTADTGEQIALLEAAQFLSLPPLNSGGPDTRTPEQKAADAQRNAEKKARLQALMNKRPATQASPSGPATAPDQKPSPGQNPPPVANP